MPPWRTAWAVAGLLAVGCVETPVDLDASHDAAFGIPGDSAEDAASGGATDVGAPDAGLAPDAAVKDAAVPDAAVPDAAVKDAAVLDAAVKDAAAPDAAVKDAAVLDAAVPDAAVLDAALPDAGQAVLDASSDAGPPDAGPETPPGDGSAPTTHSGEVVWNVIPRAGTAFCPYQSIALWKEETFTLNDPSASGFYCQSGCPPFPAPPDGEVVIVGGNYDLSVYLIFKPDVLKELSTQSFRDNFLYAKMNWRTVPKTPLKYAAGFSPGIGTGAWQEPLPKLEFVSYEPPLLHVRVSAVGLGQSSELRQEATLPYACVVQGKFGEFPSICTEVECTYLADSPGNGTHFTADVTLPLIPPQQ
jgi:hypothetical protein